MFNVNVKVKKILKVLVCASLVFGFTLSFADSSTGIGGIAANVQSSFSNVAKVITGAAFIAGFGFAMAAMFKFKQHKDNPTQIPVGTPIALLLVGAGLIFLPSLFSAAGATLFGSNATPGTISGTDTVTTGGAK